jgi:predicted amidophosphoribosyltransferase
VVPVHDLRLSAPRRLLSLLAPPRCLACTAHCSADAQLCPLCDAWLAGAPPPAGVPFAGIDAGWAAVSHEGVARDLVVALKFRRLLGAADLIAACIAERAPAGFLAATVVPVPPASSRLLRRGFDPAEEIALRLARLCGLPFEPCLTRADGPPQVGRRRAARLASPPRVRSHGAVPAAALLVDDVQTTGATLSACAGALRIAGAERVSAVTFARTP